MSFYVTTLKPLDDKGEKLRVQNGNLDLIISVCRALPFSTMQY